MPLLLPQFITGIQGETKNGHTATLEATWVGSGAFSLTTVLLSPLLRPLIPRLMFSPTFTFAFVLSFEPFSHWRYWISGGLLGKVQLRPSFGNVK